MKIKAKKLSMLAITAVMVLSMLSLSACSKSDEQSAQNNAGNTGDVEGANELSGDLRVIWWGGDVRHELTLEVIDLFEKEYPDINIIPEYMGGDSYWDKLAVQVAGGNAPDVIQFGGNYPDYVNRDALLPIDPYFGNIIDISNIDEGVIDAATMNGNTYGLCLGTNMLGIIYNKTMLDAAGMEVPEPGYTWDELEAFMEELAPKLPDGVLPMTDNSGNNTNYISFYSRQQGQNLYTTDGVTKSTPQMFTDFFGIWEGWRSKNLIPGAEMTSEYREDGADSSTLVAGKVAMTMTYSNQLAGFQDAMQDELGIMPLPDMTKGAAWIMPSQYFCISKTSARPDAAATFINFFVNDVEAGKILGSDRGISASSVIRAAVADDADEVVHKIYELYDVNADYTSPMDPNMPNDQEFTDNFRRLTQEIAFGTKDIVTAGQEAFDMVNDMIAKG